MPSTGIGCLAVPKKHEQGGAVGRACEKGPTKLFCEGIHIQLSALDKFKWDLLLSQRAVCEVRVCTSNS